MKGYLIIGMLVFGLASYGQIKPDAIVGKWLKAPKEDLVIRVYKTGTEYKGKISSWKDADHDEGNNLYIYFVSRNHVIDAQRTLSALARYANDAKGLTRVKGITNNCVYVNDGHRAFIESAKAIPAGAEIFVDYTKEYWDVLKENLKKEKNK